ncbi:MAG: hypothetical protein HC887_12145, partial [Desulfobacteraceae bacterium]|nr:hypothetical protein [Desulfobacteraceae bacterium]
MEGVCSGSQTYTISGYITGTNSVGVSGVTLTFSNSGGTVATDSSGYYSNTVNSGWSGTVTPSKSGYTFTPTSKSYSNVTANQSSQNYTAATSSTPSYTISGYVTTSSGTAISGVTMTSSSAATASTDSSGYYSLTVSSGWSGTVTPSKSGYTFTPTNKSYSSVSANQSSQNYTGTSASSGNLVWQTSKTTAVSMAISQGKKILLLAGRETCGNTQYMKNTVCESLSPPIKSLIEQYFIPWFCDVDNSTEWYSYASGLESFTLPMICVIDPNSSSSYLDRTTDVQDPQVFYSRLSQYSAPSNSYTISGYITDNYWVGVSGITLTFSNSGGSVTTTTSGYYAKTVNS